MHQADNMSAWCFDEITTVRYLHEYRNLPFSTIGEICGRAADEISAQMEFAMRHTTANPPTEDIPAAGPTWLSESECEKLSIIPDDMSALDETPYTFTLSDQQFGQLQKTVSDSIHIANNRGYLASACAIMLDVALVYVLAMRVAGLW